MEKHRVHFKKSGFLWLSIISFWGLLSLFNTSQYLLSAYVNERPVLWTTTIIWQIGWFVWALLTPLVIGLAKKHKIVRASLKQGLLRHLGLGLAVCTLHFFIEALVSYWAYYFFAAVPPSNRWFVGLISYKFHVHMFAYFAIVGVVQALIYFKQSQKIALEKSDLELKASQLEAQLMQAQLQSLKMQIHPHFLFNTHHAVIALMLKQENQQAIQMLTKLSKLLRLTLEHNQQPIINLKDEIILLQLYLDIQQVRHQNRLQIDLIIPNELHGAQVPNMLLQPLVENALKHGIEPHSQSGKLTIKVVLKQNKQLVFTISDDGKGIDLDNFKEGIGLKNTRQRLEQMYPQQFDFQLHNQDTGGTLVYIVLPYQMSPSNAGNMSNHSLI